MKKLFVILGLVIFIFSSCKKEYIASANNSQTILIPVQSGDWNTYDYGVTYSVSLNMPEITYSFNQRGQVLVYISYNNGVYEQIPEVYNNTAYSFTHNVGNVTIYAQDLSGRGTISPDNATIKIVLVDSHY
ncbi:MAG TPA: hypothetical protein VGO09_03845 [Flavisolibacter sp.]|nr:hypothetical protein [Flavisolibacter sp.]